MTPQDAARLLAEAAMSALATRAACRIALCGGPWLAPTIAGLRALPALQRLDWQHLHIFAGDDTWDAEALQQLAALPLPRANLLRPRSAGIGPLEAARDYEQVLRAHFSLAAGAVPVFDVLLQAAAGGRDAPGEVSSHDAASEVGRLVMAQPRGLPAWTLSAAVVSAARLRLMLEGPAGAHQPASRVPSTTMSMASPTPATLRAGRSGFSPR
jgi:hypothetical protein